jgi:hypothetical protein
MNLRQIRKWLLSYVVFDLLLGYAGIFPLLNIEAQRAGAQTAPTPTVTQQITMPVFTLTPTPATNAAIQITGNPGGADIFYWVVANYSVGSATPAGPFTITNGPNTLTGSNFITVIPSIPAGATSWDLLKTSTPVQPSGACNCAVATGISPTASANDQSNSTNPYTVNPVNLNALGLTLQNEVQSAGVSHLIVRQNGVFVTDLSVPITGTVNNCLTPNTIAFYSAAGTIVSCDTGFTDSAGTLTYAGSGGLTFSNTGNAGIKIQTSVDNSSITMGGNQAIKMQGGVNGGIGFDVQLVAGNGTTGFGGNLLLQAGSSTFNGAQSLSPGWVNIIAGTNANSSAGNILLMPGGGSGGGTGAVQIGCTGGLVWPCQGAPAFMTGKLNMVGKSGGAVTITVPDTVTTPYALMLPPIPGTNGFALTTDGTGITSWTAAVALGNAAAGTVFGNNTGGSTTASFITTPVLGLQNSTQGTLRLSGSAASPGQLILNIAGAAANAATLQPGANTGAVTITLPITTGTLPFFTGSPTPNDLMKWGSNGQAVDDTLITENGTTLTYTGTGGLSLTGTGSGLTQTQGTITVSSPSNNQTATWNAGGVLFQNEVHNITCTAAAANSTLMDYQVGGSSVIKAVAGALANCGTPVVYMPNGTATQAGLTFQRETNSGFFSPAANNWAWTNGTTAIVSFLGGSGFRLNTGEGYAWSNSATNASATQDTCAGRSAAGIVSADTTTCGNGLGTFIATAYQTKTNCASSTGTCGSAASGAVSIAAAATTVTVATTAVTASSRIFVFEDSTLGGTLSVTCNTTTGRTYSVTTRTAGTSFVITANAAPTTNPACLNYWVIN